MCLIIYKPKKNDRIPSRYLTNCETTNPDGFGITYLDGKCETIRTMDYDTARELLDCDRPYVAHYRYATRGAINKSNCHPFKVNGGGVLYSNGTVANLGDNKKCDTKVVADILSRYEMDCWNDILSMTETRFVYVSEKGKVSRYGKWHEREGIFYSKDNCFKKASKNYWQSSEFDYGYNENVKEPWEDYEYGQSTIDDIADGDLVAVYGTLRKGYGNHRLLAGAQSEFVGTGNTRDKYLLDASASIPYVYYGVKDKEVPVEVYKPSGDDVWQSLDTLEGHPWHYTRDLIEVELEDGKTVHAWLYFAADEQPVLY